MQAPYYGQMFCNLTLFDNIIRTQLIGLCIVIFQFGYILSSLTTPLSTNSSSAPLRYSSRIVETKSGAIRGVILELHSRHLEPVEVFKAVPYANPPIGDLRFESPQPLPPWKGTRLAETFGPVCPQNYPDIGNQTATLMSMPKGRYQYLRKLLPFLLNQSEDCLTLNIYVPGSGNRGLDAPYSVFVYIHGESYEWGSGNPYDGSILASYGHVIVITINFRLGIFGFLKTRSSTSAGTSGGNLGLLDIMAALRWTKSNIAAFGGDPLRITIVGHNTGAALANLILISKEGKGLIQRAILLSGSALSPWSIITDPDTIREQVSQQMACHLNPNRQYDLSIVSMNTTIPSRSKQEPIQTDTVLNDITNCLRSKPLEALMGVRIANIRFVPTWGPFLPLDDAPDPEFAMEHSGQGFITKEVMIGVTTTESYNDFNAADIQYGLEEEQRNRLLRTFIRNSFTFHLNEIFSAVRNEYTDWDKPIQHPINIRDSTMEALSDGHTVAPSIKVGYLHSRRGARTYLFHFGYQTKDSEYPQRLGSVRGEDVPYIFGLPLVLGMPYFPQNYSRQDMGVAEAVLNFITNFCKTGDPNESGQQQAMLHPDYGTARERTRYRGITWEPYETTSQQYLSISLKPKMKSHYRGHRIAVWMNLIPQLHRPGDSEVSMRHHHFHERESHYYVGNVRAEAYARPRQHYNFGSMGASIGYGIQESRQQTLSEEDNTLLAYGPVDCTQDSTYGETDEPNFVENMEDLLERLATKHSYSYTAALAVTIGVGCLLLVLNILIFAGIYYQRGRTRKKYISCNHNIIQSTLSVDNISNEIHSNTNSIPINGEDIPSLLTSGKESNASKPQEPPPSYTALQQGSHTPLRQDSFLNTNMSTVVQSQQTQKATSRQHRHQTIQLHNYNNHVSSPKDIESIIGQGENIGGSCTLTTSTPKYHQQSNIMMTGKLIPKRGTHITKSLNRPQPPQRTSSNPIESNNTSPNQSRSHMHLCNENQCDDLPLTSTQPVGIVIMPPTRQDNIEGNDCYFHSSNYHSSISTSNNKPNMNNNTNTSILKKRVQIQEITV